MVGVLGPRLGVGIWRSRSGLKSRSTNHSLLFVYQVEFKKTWCSWTWNIDYQPYTKFCTGDGDLCPRAMLGSGATGDLGSGGFYWVVGN